MILLLALSANAMDMDLVNLQENFGFKAVNTVVQSLAASDRSTSQITSELRRGGLERLQMRMAQDERSKGLFETPAALTGCRWNWEIRCRFTAEAVVPVRMGTFGVRCLDEATKPVEGVTLRFRIDKATDPGETAIIDVYDLSPCWRDGGQSVELFATGEAPHGPIQP